jgi:hypothetical protein
MIRLTLTEMKQANKAIDHHWFSKGSMEFFNTRIVEQPNKFNMFITSEQFNDESPKGYNIRYFNEKTSKVETIGDFQKFDSLEQAKKIRLTIAKGLEQMANREKWIMDNLSEVEFTDDWIAFIAYDGDQIASNRKSFDISYDGNICG